MGLAVNVLLQFYIDLPSSFPLPSLPSFPFSLEVVFLTLTGSTRLLSIPQRHPDDLQHKTKLVKPTVIVSGCGVCAYFSP